MWWNNLAGSYLRLGQAAEAVKILEPVTNRFPDDYGIHANLGTAYHLLGRYQEAEREIRRDTEINTNAHFGLEKYHLALLQYLSRDETYRFRHLYVEEFTEPFLMRGYSSFTPATHESLKENHDGKLTDAERKQMESNVSRLFRQTEQGAVYSAPDIDLLTLAANDAEPAYLAKWDLGADPKLEEGIIYMATLNPKEPACWTMLGTLAWHNHAYHLAKVAYQKSIELGSPQAPILKWHIGGFQQQLDNTQLIHIWAVLIPVTLLIVAAVIFYLFYKLLSFGDKKISKP